MDAQQAAHPVQMQLEAYNAKDIDEFMRWWAADCEYSAFPDQLLARGADAIRERHIARFAEPDLHGELLHRSVVGAIVVDHELVQRTYPEGPGEVEVLCTYEVVDGLIQRAWFAIGEPRLHEQRAESAPS